MWEISGRCVEDDLACTLVVGLVAWLVGGGWCWSGWGSSCFELSGGGRRIDFNGGR